jgi:hypothetical protein
MLDFVTGVVLFAVLFLGALVLEQYLGRNSE